GFFVNTLVMRVGVRGEEQVEELLEQVKKVCLGAYAHQDVPFEKLVEELQPERDLGRQPLFQAMYLFDNASSPALELPGVTITPFGGAQESSTFDLSLSVQEKEDELIVSMLYRVDLFNSGTIRRMLSGLQNLLQGLQADPARKVCDLPLMSGLELKQMI